MSRLGVVPVSTQGVHVSRLGVVPVSTQGVHVSN